MFLCRRLPISLCYTVVWWCIVLQGGVSVMMAKKQLEHRNITTIMDTYSYVSLKCDFADRIMRFVLDPSS